MVFKGIVQCSYNEENIVMDGWMDGWFICRLEEMEGNGERKIYSNHN